MNFVLDACAIIAFLRGEEGSEVVSDLLSDTTVRCYVHAVNLCEVYYDFVRVADVRTARSAVRDMARLGLSTRRDMGKSFWQHVGELKGTIRRVSLADCFAIALSHRLVAEIVTSDRREFAPLASAGLCRVRFIR